MLCGQKTRSEQYYEVHVRHKGLALAQLGFIFNTTPDLSAKNPNHTQTSPLPQQWVVLSESVVSISQVSGARGQPPVPPPPFFFFFLWSSNVWQQEAALRIKQDCLEQWKLVEDDIIWELTGMERKSPPRVKTQGFEREMLGRIVPLE